MDKVFIVTGASRGLGQAITSQLASLGCRVLACARSKDALSKLWNHVEGVEWTVSDLSKLDEAQRLVDLALEKFGQLDGLINNAGTIEPIQPLENSDPQAWAQAITVNLTAPALLMRAALPHLKQQRGRVVNISSGAAIKVMQGWGAYCTSKAGLLHLTTITAAEYPEVAFFSLRPGVIDTQMQTEIRESVGMTDADREKFCGLKETGGLVPPEVPARSAVWLALHGPLDRSGEFIQYTDEQVISGTEQLFATR
jgi:NAD(P)-dependent dehydrogenase (short-subunit alcohol dehydrogenase family)